MWDSSLCFTRSYENIINSTHCGISGLPGASFASGTTVNEPITIQWPMAEKDLTSHPLPYISYNLRNCCHKTHWRSLFVPDLRNESNDNPSWWPFLILLQEKEPCKPRKEPFLHHPQCFKVRKNTLLRDSVKSSERTIWHKWSRQSLELPIQTRRDCK